MTAKEVRPCLPWTFQRQCVKCRAKVSKVQGWDYRGNFICGVCAPDQKKALKLMRRAVGGQASADLRV